MKATQILVSFCVFSAVLAGTAFAQSRSGTIYGSVRDATGGVLPGATVIATEQGTKLTRETTTDEQGRFEFPLLPIGRYTLTITLAGFSDATAADVQLETQQNREVTFALTLSGIQEQTTVTAAAMLVEIERRTGSLGQVINSKQVADLPLNGRNFVQLGTLALRRHQGRGRVLQQQGHDRGLDPRQHVAVGAGHARERQRLPPRRRRQQRADGGRHLGAAVGRVDSGVQGSHQQLLGRVRQPRRRHGAGVDQERQQRVPRLGLRVPPQRRLRRPQLLRGRKGQVQPEPVRRLDRRTDRQGQDVLLRRLSGLHDSAGAAGARHGADREDAPRRLQRELPRRAGTDDLRPQHDHGQPGHRAAAADGVREQPDSDQPSRSDRAPAAQPVSAADLHRSPVGELPRQPGQGLQAALHQRPRRSQLLEQRHAVRALHMGSRDAVLPLRLPVWPRRHLQHRRLPDAGAQPGHLGDAHLLAASPQPGDLRLQLRPERHDVDRPGTEPAGAVRHPGRQRGRLRELGPDADQPRRSATPALATACSRRSSAAPMCSTSPTR